MIYPPHGPEFYRGQARDALIGAVIIGSVVLLGLAVAVWTLVTR